MNNNENFYIRIPRVRFFKEVQRLSRHTSCIGFSLAPQVPDAISGQNYNFSNKQINR